MTLTLLAQVRAAPGTEDKIREEMQKLVAPTRAEPGCLQYDFYADDQDPHLFMFFEVWESRAHLDAHKTTPHIQASRAATEGLGQVWSVHELRQLGDR